MYTQIPTDRAATYEWRSESTQKPPKNAVFTRETNAAAWRAPKRVWVHGGDLARSFAALTQLAASGIQTVVETGHPLAAHADALGELLLVSSQPETSGAVHVAALDALGSERKQKLAAGSGALGSVGAGALQGPLVLHQGEIGVLDPLGEEEDLVLVEADELGIGAPLAGQIAALQEDRAPQPGAILGAVVLDGADQSGDHSSSSVRAMIASCASGMRDTNWAQ